MNEIAHGAVYMITNVITGAAYIGLTRKTPEKRFAGHWKASKREDSVLYRAMRKYGRDAFSISILAFAENDEDLCRLEREFIEQHRTHVRNGGYNMTSGGEGSPDICDETRARMRHAAAQRLINGSREKIAISLKGRKRSPEAIEATAAKLRGRPLSEAHKALISRAHKGREISEEQRAKISAKLAGRKLPPEHIEAVRQSKLGRRWTPERRQRLKEAMARPEVRAKKSAASHLMWERRRAGSNV